MLQQIRDRTSGIVAGFIVAMLVVPFAFFGIETFNSGGGDPVVAKVGGQKIRQSQFQNAYEQRYQQFVALMGDNFRADRFDQTLFRSMVLNDMTQESLMRQYAEKAGYRANDAVVFDYLSRIPVFQKDGRFDTAAYREALSRQGLTPQKFEEQVRVSIAIDQLREGVVDSAFVTDAELQQAWKLAQQQRVAGYALFDAARYLPQASVTEDQVKARYEEKKTQLMSPERIRVAYVQLSLETLPPAAPPSEEVIKALYDAEKDGRFTAPEERRASHILVNFGADKAAAKAKAEALAAKLKAGTSFAELAKSSSDDTGSKDKGGDLGWNRRGQMPESFEKVMFTLDKGQVSEPVETEFGWHLIRLDDIKRSTVRPLTDPAAREELVTLYQNREKQKRYQELSEKIEQLAFENPASLDPVAKELGLTVQTSDWFTRAGGIGLLALEPVKQAAFSAEVLKDGENSKPLPAGDNSLVVLRKAEYEAPRQRSLEETAEALREELKAEAAKAQAAAEAKKLQAELAAGKTLEEAGAASGAELHAAEPVRRDSATLDRKLVEALFKLPRPAAGKPQTSEVTTATGGVAVLAFTAVVDPAPATEAELGQLRQRLRDMQGGAEFGAYQKAMAQKVKVELLAQPKPAETPTPES